MKSTLNQGSSIPFGKTWTALLALFTGLTLTASAAEHSEAAAPTGEHAETQAEEHGADLSEYNLFNPVPEEKLRHFRPDSPLRTQNPFTVDPGHFQVEVEAFEYEYNKDDGIEEKLTAVGHFNLKAGVLSWLDVELLVPTYTRVEETVTFDVPPTKETRSGFGDLSLRAKINLTGNDSGKLGVGIIPMVSFPTSENHLGSDHAEFGVFVPVSYELPGHLEARFMTGVESIPGVDGREYLFVNSGAVMGHLAERWEWYAEIWSGSSTEAGSEIEVTGGGGIIFAATHNLHLDAGFNAGLTKAAPDIQGFFGLSVRF